MKSSNSVSKKFFIAGAFVAVLAIFFLASAAFLSGPRDSVKNEKNFRFEIPAGSTVRSVAHSLYAQGIIKSETLFYYSARFPFLTFETKRAVIKSGVYNLKSSMSVKEILSLFDSGKQEYVRVVVPEGLTIKKIGSLLESKGVCSAGDFVKSCRSEALLGNYKVEAENFEGFLFPDTYNFAPGMSADDVVKMMVDNFFSKISQIPGLQGKTPSQFYDALTLASIVEREYRVASEAPLIASVFLNRIKDGAGLYSCATIEYIITEIQNRPHPEVITYADLKIDSPYNTYKWAGLTPGPISNPGIIALKAAVSPADTNYRFFVLKGDGSGTHNFTKNQVEHQKAINQYRTKKAAGSN